jgi:hypothetical protein
VVRPTCRGLIGPFLCIYDSGLPGEARPPLLTAARLADYCREVAGRIYEKRMSTGAYIGGGIVAVGTIEEGRTIDAA